MKKDRKSKALALTISIFLMIIVVIVFVSGRKNETNNVTDEVDSKIVDAQMDNVDDTEAYFFEIETQYCKLYFPEMWKDNIEIRYKEEMGYKVGFYGVVENKEAQLLFEVCFNSDDGELLGYLEIDEDIVNISIDINDIVFDDSWEEEEMQQIYTMQEDVNFVIDTLNKNENYVIPN